VGQDALSGIQASAEGFFTVVPAMPPKADAVPYSQNTKPTLIVRQADARCRQPTDNASLKKSSPRVPRLSPPTTILPVTWHDDLDARST